MIVLFILMVIAQISSLVFAVYCLRVTKNKDIKKVSVFLKKFMKILLGVLIVCFGIAIVAEVVAFLDSFLVVVVIVQTIIDLYIIISITKYGLKFIDNLNNDRIYVKENSNCLLEVSRLFILYSIINGIAGITLAVINNIVEDLYFDYTITISTSYFMYLLIGMVFYVLHLLFERSIEIYEENELTI